jgi:integrase
VRIYPRGKRGILWADFTVDGQRVTRSTGTTDERQAKEWAARTSADLWRTQRLGERPRVTFGEAVLDWLRKHGAERRSLETMKYRLSWLVARIEHEPLQALTATRVSALLAERQSPASTLNRLVAEVSKILHHAHRCGWIDAVPALRRYREEKPEPRWLTHDEADRLLAELPRHLADMARFALATGLRESNVRLLRWSQVDAARRVAWVLSRDAKNGKALNVPLNDDAIEVLQAQRGRHGVFVFTYERWDGKRGPVHNCSSHAWYKAIARAGLHGLRWHDLRHTWATWHVQKGTPLPALQVLGGWSSYAMVLRYAHIAESFAAQYAHGSLRDKSVTTAPTNQLLGNPEQLLTTDAEEEKMGWLMGLEPTTTGITIRQPTDKVLNLNDALARKRRKTA